MDGKAVNGSEWRACPDGYRFAEQVEGESGSDEDDLQQTDVIDDNNDKAVTAGKVETDLLGVDSVVGADGKTGGGQDSTDLDGDDLVLQQLEAANILLKKQAATREQQLSDERDRRIAMLRAENLKLSENMKGDIGGAKTKKLEVHPKNSKIKKSRNPKKTEVASLQGHLTRNQLRASEYRPEESSLYSGINIDGIRKIPVIRTEVDRLIGRVQHQAPSLDSRPSFVLDENPHVQKASHPHLTQREKPVAGIDPDTSSDDDVDDQPKAGFVFRWRRDQNGEKYFVEEKQEADNVDNGLVYKYVRDEATGRSYKRLVLKTDPDKELTPQWVVDPRTGKQVQMLVPGSSVHQQKQSLRSFGQQGFTAGSQGQHSEGQDDNFVTPLPPSGRRKAPQLSSSAPSKFTDLQHEDKQGKMPSIVYFARSCPVSWTSKVTSDKLNMGLWSWAYIAELLASRTGQASELQHGELEARLQHYLNVLEIALQPSNTSDFDNHAWRVARLYGEKVQQKIERGDTWLGFERRYGSDSQPHELMAAEKELAPKVKKVKEEVSGRIKASDESHVRKRTCTTWNTSTVEGKCEYEASNDGRTCSRKHECSWCKDKGKTSLSHQRSFCRQRIAAGEQ